MLRFTLPFVAVVMLLVACADKPAALAPADQTYTVRGTIERLPAPGAPLIVHHQPIPEFIGRDGKVIGMKDMSMEFAHVAPSVALASHKVGDAIMMTFEVRWKSEPRSLVTAIVPAEASAPTDQK